jgi:hypothetical protein
MCKMTKHWKDENMQSCDIEMLKPMHLFGVLIYKVSSFHVFQKLKFLTLKHLDH